MAVRVVAGRTDCRQGDRRKDRWPNVRQTAIRMAEDRTEGPQYGQIRETAANMISVKNVLLARCR
jgi:hypothetical protein